MIHINAAKHGSRHQSVMTESLHWLGALCSSGTLGEGGLLLDLFVAGAAGSVVHCGPMCGVFVLGQTSERMARLPLDRLCERQRIGSGLLLPYHLGRLTTYAGLGAAAATSTAFFEQGPWFAGLSAVLLVIAALLFLTHAVLRILPTGTGLNRVPRVWGKLIGYFTRRIRRGSTSGEYLLGLTLGFLPCGFLYAAIAAAAASARPELGAAAMIAFGTGTTPVLMVVGIAGHTAGRRWSNSVTAAAPVLMVLNALMLLALAWQRLV